MDFYSCFCRTCQLQSLTKAECHSCACGTSTCVSAYGSHELFTRSTRPRESPRAKTPAVSIPASFVYVRRVLDADLLTFHFVSSVPFDVWKINYRHVASSVYLTACNHVYATKCIARAISAGRQRLSFD